jgi:hypothetical protein
MYGRKRTRQSGDGIAQPAADLVARLLRREHDPALGSSAAECP